MDAQALFRRITAAQHHLETLEQYTSASPDHQALVSESWRELGSILQELAGALAPTEAERAYVLVDRRMEELVARDEAILTNIAEGIVVFDPHGNVLDMNPAALRIHGFEKVQEAQRHLQEFSTLFELHSLDGNLLPIQDWPLNRVLRGETLAGLQVQVRRLDTGTVWIGSYSGAPVRDADGRMTFGVLTLHDITAREKAEAERDQMLAQVEQQRQHAEELATALQRERDLLQVIMENTRAQLAYLDRQFRFVRVNSAYAQGSGHSVEELIGRGHFDLFPNVENQAIFERVRLTGEPVAFHARPFVYLDQPDRGITYWDWTLAPIKDEGGRVEGLVISLLDVTEHERAQLERDLRLSHLKDLIQVSEQVLAETTAEGLLQRVVDAARKLVDAKVSVAGLVRDNTFTIGAASRAEDVSLCPPGAVFGMERGGVYLDLFQKRVSLRLTNEQLVRHPAWWGLPKGHAPLHGLLGARLVGGDGQAMGMIMVSHKEHGEFTAEDEVLLVQLAALASLGLQHIQAKTNAERRANELDAVFAAMTDAVSVYDTGGMVTRANPAALAMHGLDLMNVDRVTLAQQIGVRGTDGRLATSDTLPTIRALRGEQVANEYIVFTDPEGRDRIVLASASPLLDNGNVAGAVAVWHDVTEREHIMGQLENERARLRAIIENAPEAIVVADRQCQIVLANPAAESLGVRAALSYPDESQVQCEVRYPDGTLGSSSELLASSASEGRALKNVEMTLTHFGGERRVFLVSAAPIRDQHGKSSGVVGVFEDITQREQMEKALEQSNRDMLLLNRLGQELGATLDLSQVLGRILEAVGALVPAEDNAIWLWDEERPGWLVCRAALSSQTAQSPVNVHLRAGEGVVGWVAVHGESVAIPRLTEDPRFSSAVYAQTGSKARSILAVPLLVRVKVTGVLNVVDKLSGEFDARDRTLVATLAASAAIAVENARLHDQAMQAAVTAERGRLARDLHDAVSQTLFSASVISETLPRLWKRDPDRVLRGLEQLHQLTRGALAEMRSLLVELRPTALVETDLGDLVRQLAEATMSRTRITVSVATEGKCALSPEVQIALYRITQEALNNVVKHARASRVTLSLFSRPEKVELRVKDDGRGFDPGQVKPGHLGLGIMRERAQSLGIALEIISQPNQGAEIVATF